MGGEQIVDGAFAPLEQPGAVGVDRDDQQPGVAHAQLGARATAAAGADQSAPATRRPGLEEQQLDGAADGVLREHARGNHARVVDDKAVAWPQERGQVDDVTVVQGSPAPIDDQQARAVAAGGRRLGDRVRRQLVIEVREVHVPAVYTPPRAGSRRSG